MKHQLDNYITQYIIVSQYMQPTELFSYYDTVFPCIKSLDIQNIDIKYNVIDV